jgi:diguanylate cyclase (GGDEF)-like protein
MELDLPGVDKRTSLPRALILIPVLTLIVLCVLWITILVRLHVEKAAVLRETEDAANTLARSLQSHTVKTIHDVDEIALLIKYGYESTPATFDLAQYQARGLISADTALQVTVVGANGHVLTSTLKFTGVVDLSDREHFLVHRLNPQAGLFISQPVIGRVSKQWSVQSTRRIDRPDGSFGGVVVISEDPAYLTDGFYNSAALGQHGLIAVLSRHGFTLSRRAGEAPSTTGGPLPEGYNGFLRTRDGTVSDPVDHIERIVASRSIDRYDLMVVAGLSVDEALDDYYKMRRVYVTMALVISAILVSFSSWIMALVAKLLKGKEALRCLSETDRLTGLFNRRRIEDLLNEAVASPDAFGNVAVIFVDLDNFKQLNDAHGHQAGDEALVILADRVRAAVGARGATGRLGGDEFLVIVRAARAGEIATQTVEDIVQALAMAISVAGRSHVMRASLGVAVLAQGDTADDLVKNADEAMYEAKECGRASATTTWRAYDRPVIRGIEPSGDDISGIRDLPPGKKRHLRQPHCADGEEAVLRSNP